MQLTIDSAEPLEHVLRVVGSLYGTELSVAPGPTASATQKAAAKAPARKRRRKAAVRTSTAKRAAGPTASAADVRAWARAQGHAISSRGSIAADVTRAYADAHR